MAKLFTVQPLALQTAFSELKHQAFAQQFVFVGTPGSVSERVVNGARFLYRQYYDPNGKKAAEYIGPVDAPETASRADAVRQEIEITNVLLSTARLLANGGYVRVDARTDAILAALSNGGFFDAGGLVVGSHAYGALLNELGVRSAGYTTEDIDLARDRALKLSSDRTFEKMLDDSKLQLLPAPQLDRKKPSVSFKPPGADRLRVDLLIPTEGDAIKVLEARDLGAHALALPFFRYLLSDPMRAVILGRTSVIPVNVPRIERFAWHKLLVSTLRDRTSDKKPKDVEQAAVLIAVLAEREPTLLEEGLRALPSSMRKATKLAAKQVIDRLAKAGHENAASMMSDLLA